MFLLSGFELERLGFTSNYNEWLIGPEKLDVSLNEFESEWLEFFIIYSTE